MMVSNIGNLNDCSQDKLILLFLDKEKSQNNHGREGANNPNIENNNNIHQNNGIRINQGGAMNNQYNNGNNYNNNFQNNGVNQVEKQMNNQPNNFSNGQVPAFGQGGQGAWMGQGGSNQNNYMVIGLYQNSINNMNN